jgi:hypothetical protein
VVATRGWAVFLLLAIGCGSRSGLPIPDSDGSDGDSGTSPNPLCATQPPGEVITLQSGEMQPASIGVSGEWLFVAEWPFTGNVFRMPRTGGSASSVLSSDEAAVNQLVTGGNAAYWVTQGWGDADGALRSGFSKAETLLGSLTRPQGLAYFEGAVYVVDGLGPPNALDGRVQRLELKQKGAPTTLASGLADPLAITVDVSGVYFSVTGGGVYSVPHAGGVPVALDTSDYVPQLASNGHGLFWSDVASLRWRDHTTGVTEQIAVGLGLIEGIAADENGVFFVTRSAPSDSATGSVFEVREQGVEQLATVAEAPLGIAIDPSAIYFVTIHGGMGSVNMLCRRSQRSP